MAMGYTFLFFLFYYYDVMLLHVNSNPNTKFQSLHHLLSTNKLFTKYFFNKIKKKYFQILKLYFAKQILIFYTCLKREQLIQKSKEFDLQWITNNDLIFQMDGIN